jgi:hypothetical protein
VLECKRCARFKSILVYCPTLIISPAKSFTKVNFLVKKLDSIKFLVH